MSMSGIKVNDVVQSFFNQDFKKAKLHAYFTCVIEKPAEGGAEEITLEDVSVDPLPDNCTQEQNKEVFEKMKKTLSEKHPKFIVFDFRFKTSDGRDTDKMALITWISDNAPIKIRMKYGSTKEALKLEGVKRFQASDMDDLDYNTMVSELRK